MNVAQASIPSRLWWDPAFRTATPQRPARIGAQRVAVIPLHDPEALVQAVVKCDCPYPITPRNREDFARSALRALGLLPKPRTKTKAKKPRLDTVVYTRVPDASGRLSIRKRTRTYS